MLRGEVEPFKNERAFGAPKAPFHRAVLSGYAVDGVGVATRDDVITKGSFVDGIDVPQFTCVS